MSALEVSGLTVEYSSGGYAVRPLDGFELAMERGELAVVLGASGCGKTTLLSALAGLLRPASGSIRVAGQELVGLPAAELTRYRQRGVGVVFQSFNLVPSLSAVENVAIVLLNAGWRASAARRRAEELLARVDLAEMAGHHPGRLSGGQQQRVAIARALALDPPLVLADEPTAHLDYIQVEGVLEILRQLARSERTVIVATHDERLLPLAHRVVELTPRRAGGGEPERRLLAAGEVLFRQGERGELVYLVESGEIGLYRQLAAGGAELLRTVPAGGYFGELAPMFGLPRSATAEAIGEAVVTGLPLSLVAEQVAGAGPLGDGARR